MKANEWRRVIFLNEYYPSTSLDSFRSIRFNFSVPIQSHLIIYSARCISLFLVNIFQFLSLFFHYSWWCGRAFSMRSNLVDVNELFALVMGLHLTLSAANRFSLVFQCNFETCLMTPKNKQAFSLVVVGASVGCCEWQCFGRKTWLKCHLSHIKCPYSKHLEGDTRNDIQQMMW